MEGSAAASIVHVLPADAARGAQLFARDLRHALDGRPDHHRTLAIFGPRLGDGGLDPNEALGVPDGLGRRVGVSPHAAAALRGALKRLRPDVVVAHGGEALLYAALATGARTPVVYTKIGASDPRLSGRARRAFWQLVARRPQVVVAVSHEMVDEVRTLLRVRAERVVLVPNGRDPAFFHPAEGRAAARPHLIAVGSLTVDKRPELFISLVERLRHEGHVIDATIVGDGPLMGAVRTQASPAGVTVLGARSDVPELLRAADILILTSQVEGMPGVLIEAGMTGLPVVTTAASGATTVVRDGVTGLVVPLDDPQALLTATRRLVVDSGLRARFGRAARQHCVAEFSLDAVAAAWQSVLDRVLGRRGAAGTGSALLADPR